MEMFGMKKGIYTHRSLESRLTPSHAGPLREAPGHIRIQERRKKSMAQSLH